MTRYHEMRRCEWSEKKCVRLVIEYDPEVSGNVYLREEEVLPERITEPNPNVRSILDEIILTVPDLDWALGHLLKVWPIVMDQSVADASFDRSRGLRTDPISAREAIVSAALAWRQGGSAMALVAAIDAAAAEGHVTLPSDRSEP